MAAKCNKDFADRVYMQMITPYKARYVNACHDLQKLEYFENFPNVRRYISQIESISKVLPTELQQNAFYPYAGTDIFWSASFGNMIMEDKNYDTQEQDPSSWWSKSDYSVDRISNLVGKLKSRKIIPIQNQIHFNHPTLKIQG
jgi:hypothetical protein